MQDRFHNPRLMAKLSSSFRLTRTWKKDANHVKVIAKPKSELKLNTPSTHLHRLKAYMGHHLPVDKLLHFTGSLQFWRNKKVQHSKGFLFALIIHCTKCRKFQASLDGPFGTMIEWCLYCCSKLNVSWLLGFSPLGKALDLGPRSQVNGRLGQWHHPFVCR